MSDLISLEKYAELCALMSETAGDENKEAEIAQSKGVSVADWKKAKQGYTATMSDPKDMGKTAMAFMPLYRAALEKKRGGGAPGTLEDYSVIHAEMAFLKDPQDPGKKIDFMVVLNNHGYSHSKWLEMESYWTPRVSDPQSPLYNQEESKKFSEIIQKEADRIHGIKR